MTTAARLRPTCCTRPAESPAPAADVLDNPWLLLLHLTGPKQNICKQHTSCHPQQPVIHPPLLHLLRNRSQNPIFATFYITWFPATAHTSSRHQILVAQDQQPCGPLGFYSITRLLCALASITPNFCATTEIQSTMSSSQTNAWLRAQRKLDLVQVADSVGLKKYAVFLSCTSSFFFLRAETSGVGLWARRVRDSWSSRAPKELDATMGHWTMQHRSIAASSKRQNCPS